MRRDPTVRTSRRGISATEFALWLPIIVVLVTGVIEFSWYMTQTLNVSRAARDGSRYGASVYEPPAMTRGTRTVPEAEAFARDILEGAGLACGSDCEIEANYETDPFEMIRVTVTYPYHSLFGVVPISETIRYTFVTAVEVQ